MLKQRLRRLCATCLATPLSYHLSYPSSIWPGRGTTFNSFTATAFQRTPCVCEDSVWLCKPCGRSLANDDTTYSRGWAWRTRYSRYLDGLRTRIGEGYQGVKCGRVEFCLAAQEIEVEIDCHPNEWMADQLDYGHDTDYHNGPTPSRVIEGREGRDEEKPLSPVVKRRLRIGACVDEHENERETTGYLLREQSGQDRSWCGWCSRIVPGEKDSIQN